jgi:hypothetical protein
MIIYDDIEFEEAGLRIGQKEMFPHLQGDIEGEIVARHPVLTDIWLVWFPAKAMHLTLSEEYISKNFGNVKA